METCQPVVASCSQAVKTRPGRVDLSDRKIRALDVGNPGTSDGKPEGDGWDRE